MDDGGTSSGGLGTALLEALRRLRSEPFLFVVALILIAALVAGIGLSGQSWTALLVLIGVLALSALFVYVLDRRQASKDPVDEAPPTNQVPPKSSAAAGQAKPVRQPPPHPARRTGDVGVNDLVQALAEALPNDDEILAIAGSSALTLRRLRRSTRPDIFWHNVVQRAQREGKLEVLLDVAISHADDDQGLVSTVRTYRQLS